MRAVPVAAVAIVAAIALAGCGPQPETGSAPPAPTTDPLTNPSVTPAASQPLPTPTIGEQHTHDESESDPPTLEGDERAATLQRAEAAVTAFCQPGLTAEAWLGGLNPYLTQRAGAAFQTVDPANIPCTQVTGGASFTSDANEHYAELLVPTDAGDFSVIMERFDTAQPWLAERIQPVQ